MSFQPSVAQYFCSKKRRANNIDELKTNSSKVLVLDSTSSDNLNTESKIVKGDIVKNPKIVYTNSQLKVCNQTDEGPKYVKKDCSTSATNSKRKKDLKKSNEPDIRKILLNLQNNERKISEDCTTRNVPEKTSDENTAIASTPTKKVGSNVPFLIKGLLSPTRDGKEATKILNYNLEPTVFKNDENELKVENKTSESGNEENKVNIKINENESDNGQMLENKILTNTSVDNDNADSKATNLGENLSKTNLLRKDLNLGQLKSFLSRSSRLKEMKEALNKINKEQAKLKSIQDQLTPKKPVLEKFDAVELEIPYASPRKTPVKLLASPSSGSKFTPSRLFAEPPTTVVSPVKSPYKSPAFKRYQALVTEDRSTLTLPFKYRALAEMFHCMDTIVSMFFNRKETITFANLKPAVEEMKKRTLTEYQLGQIQTVFPEGFEFHQEKIHKFGTTMQSDKYNLVITPKLKSENEPGKHSTMTPSCLLERKRAFYKALLDMTKNHHEEFLGSLDPPMHVPKDRLTRWHPNFDVDGVPDIASSPLPQPPNVEKITTAKDVLERSRSLFTANPRLQKALERVCERNQNSTPSPAPAPTIPSISLKGIPKCLLEKVRAKQAAKAQELMTRTPAQAKEAVRLTRLPEIARIIRNLFVAEKKNVLPRDLVLKKLDDSFRENLTISELDDHVKLLSEHTPGWMTFCNIRKTDFIKLSKNADMLRIMKRLESLAVEKGF